MLHGFKKTITVTLAYCRATIIKKHFYVTFLFLIKKTFNYYLYIISISSKDDAFCKFTSHEYSGKLLM